LWRRPNLEFDESDKTFTWLKHPAYRMMVGIQINLGWRSDCGHRSG
jgi:hypothetical protein